MEYNTKFLDLLSNYSFFIKENYLGESCSISDATQGLIACTPSIHKLIFCHTILILILLVISCQPLP